MSDEAALLAAIIAHPDEDTPRLMYADWLEEHGQPDRAEFIRLECRMIPTTTFNSPDDERWEELLVAHRELAREHAAIRQRKVGIPSRDAGAVGHSR